MRLSQTILLFASSFAALMLTATIASAQAKSDSVVKIDSTAEKPDAAGKQLVILKFTIDDGWHLYANPVPKDFPGIPLEVKFNGKTKPATFKVDYPEGKEVKDVDTGTYKIYEGKAEVKLTVQRAKDDTGPLELSVKLQACTDKKCLLPATVKVSVP